MHLHILREPHPLNRDEFPLYLATPNAMKNLVKIFFNRFNRATSSKFYVNDPNLCVNRLVLFYLRVAFYCSSIICCIHITSSR